MARRPVPTRGAPPRSSGRRRRRRRCTATGASRRRWSIAGLMPTACPARARISSPRTRHPRRAGWSRRPRPGAERWHEPDRFPAPWPGRSGDGPAGRHGAPAALGTGVFIGVASVLFLLFLAAYTMRMSAPDWRAIRLPWQVWLSTALLAAGSLAMADAARAARAGARPARLARCRAAGGGALHRFAAMGMACPCKQGERGGQSRRQLLLPADRHARPAVLGGVAAWLLVTLRRGAGEAMPAPRCAWRCARAIGTSAGALAGAAGRCAGSRPRWCASSAAAREAAAEPKRNGSKTAAGGERWSRKQPRPSGRPTYRAAGAAVADWRSDQHAFQVSWARP